MKKIILCTCTAVALMFGFESEGMIINPQKDASRTETNQTVTVTFNGEMIIDYDTRQISVRDGRIEEEALRKGREEKGPGGVRYRLCFDRIPLTLSRDQLWVSYENINAKGYTRLFGNRIFLYNVIINCPCVDICAQESLFGKLFIENNGEQQFTSIFFFKQLSPAPGEQLSTPSRMVSLPVSHLCSFKVIDL